MKTRGFTLLELLIALSVFSILSVMAYSGLRMVLNAKERTEEQANRLVELQTAFMFMERDFELAVGRSVRDTFGDRQPAMVGGGFGAAVVELTRSGYRNPTGAPRSSMQRVGYKLADGTVSRLTWAMLDQPNLSEAFERPVLKGVKKLELRYLDKTNSWQPSWPPSVGNSDPSILPKAVELTVELEGMGSVKRVFRVPPGEADVPKQPPAPGGTAGNPGGTAGNTPGNPGGATGNTSGNPGGGAAANGARNLPPGER